MKPPATALAERALEIVGGLLAGERDERRAAALRSVVAVLGLLRSELDTAVATRTAVADGYRHVLAEADLLGAQGAGPATRQALGMLGCPTSLVVSELDQELDVLRASAIELQEWLETLGSPEAAQLRRQLWRAEHADARARDRYVPFW